MKGTAELLLLGAVCTACWLRTPVGGLVHNGVAWLRDQPTRDLLSHFDTQLPAHMEQTLREVQVVREGAPDPADIPEGWSPALHMAVHTHLGEGAAEEIAALGLTEPEAALEIWAIGVEQRERAIRRAAAAGEATPEALAAHRRFLPAEQAAEADRAVGEVLALATALDLSWPVSPDWRVSSPFGWRNHPTLNKRRFHEGIDLATPVGTPVQAAGGGTVVRARADSVNGKYVKLSHGHGVTSAYCHGSAFRVAKGQRVQRGDHVMDSGNTGRSSGPHLHFGLRIDGHSVDPSLLRSDGWTPPDTTPEKVHEAAHEAKPEAAHEAKPEAAPEAPSPEPPSAESPSAEAPSPEQPSPESPSSEVVPEASEAEPTAGGTAGDEIGKGNEDEGT